MPSAVTFAHVAGNPMLLVSPVLLKSGQQALFRPLMAQDAQTLGRYFLSLSPATRSLYGPHPFDQATADHLCATINPAENLRMIATLNTTPQEQIIAYFILQMSVTNDDAQRYAKLNIPLDSATDCTVAPSVADAYQSQGLGSALMRLLIDVAGRLGRQRMVLMSGTQARNHRAIRLYQKLGFRKVGEFLYTNGINNYDMILDL
jgi:ribosomal protein S18 acetylase RimI-like enzyme